MTRSGRKGTFTRRQTSVPAAPSRAATDPAEHLANVVANRGHGVAELNEFDLGRLAAIPLLAANLPKIRRKCLAGKTGTTLKTQKRLLGHAADYLRWYRDAKGAWPEHPDEADVAFCHGIVPWLKEQSISEPERSVRFRTFRACMEAVGVDGTNLPINPFASRDVAGSPRKELSPEGARALLKQAKMEARVVLSRREEVVRLSVIGEDPRRGHGGKWGAWKEPANRVWVMRNVFKLRIESYDKMRFEGGLNLEVKGLEGRPGAEIVSKVGEIVRQVGWKGHLRWFFPWSDDMAPFLAMFLLRTGANLSDAASLRSGLWEEPYPFVVGDSSNETHVYIVTYKTRGRHDTASESKVKKFVSARRPWSFPYRVLSAVEDLTRNLRVEIDRQVAELRAKPALSEREASDLERLASIRDDLFIYKTEQAITSLAWETRRHGDSPAWLAALMTRAGVPTGARLLRDGPILSSYAQSGENIFVSQLTAMHADKETTALYLRRSKTLERIFDQASAVFGLSLELIEKDRFEIGELKRLLAGQGLDDEKIANLEDPDNVTQWGNGCASPTEPPREFARGTPAGSVCVAQDCIDGCPHARWFRDSIGHVARNLVVSETAMATLGIESTEGSSHQSRIDRCRTLLGHWPASEVSKAIEEARRQLSDPSDLFLGAAT